MKLTIFHIASHFFKIKPSYNGLSATFKVFLQCLDGPVEYSDNFNNQRKLYIKEKLRNRPNTLKFMEIMTSKNKYNLQKLCRFVAIINKSVCPPS
jgi:hypothetical protein